MAQSITIPRKLTPADIRATISELCVKHNYNPFEELIDLARSYQDVDVDGKVVRCPVCSPEQRITIAKELAQYIAPKIKAVEVAVDSKENEFTMKITHFSEDGKTLDVPVKVEEITVPRVVVEEPVDEDARDKPTI